MTLADVWLCGSAFLAGVVNSVAGGGTLLTFPMLIWILGGTPEAAVVANASSTVSLLPGSLGSMWGYRRELVGTERWIAWLFLPSLVGGTLGALLVATLDPHIFERLVPWLILMASALLAFQPMISKWLGVGLPHQQLSTKGMIGVASFQLLVAIYGGYFGAGIGILMLSALAMMGLADFHVMNALKALFGTTINFVAAGVFIAGGQVNWRYAAPMAVAAILGGFWGAAVARKLDRTLVRRFVVVLGFTLALYYFIRVYDPETVTEAVKAAQSLSSALNSSTESPEALI